MLAQLFGYGLAASNWPSGSPVVAPIRRGVYYFSGWASPRPEFRCVTGREAPAEFPWESIRATKPGYPVVNRVPKRGFYDEKSKTVARAQIADIERAGFDFAVYQVHWSHEMALPNKLPGWETRHCEPLTMAHAARNHAAIAPRLGFCVSFFDVMSAEDTTAAEYWKARITRDRWRATDYLTDVSAFVHRLEREFFSSPGYLRIGGRPVLVLGTPEHWERNAKRFRLDVRAVFDQLRKSSRDNLYLVATQTPPETYHKVISWGFDAVTEYLHHVNGSGYDDVMVTYRWRWREGAGLVANTGAKYWVPLSAGYDARAWSIPAPVETATPDQFRRHVLEASRFARENSGVTDGITIACAWNEFGEGVAIEPMANDRRMLHPGDEMVAAHREAVRLDSR